jgi:hypothetical protein
MRLFKLSTFSRILYDESNHEFIDNAEDVWKARFARRVETQLSVLSVALKPRHKKASMLWCAMHMAEGDPALLICEFEDQNQRDSRIAVRNTAAAATTPTNNPSISTRRPENSSSHLLGLRASRLRKANISAMDTFNAVAEIQRQLGALTSLEDLFKLVVGMVRELTQFHRVMLYRFDEKANGSVVAESIDQHASTVRYNGLQFPHTDIPKQARDLYKINKIRVLYNRNEETARLVCNTPQDFLIPLDLTNSYLRAMSPVHLKYLQNMEVCASMSISLVVNEELWGLVACHGYAPMRLSLPLRELCRTLGTSASTNITRLIHASRLEHRQTIITGSGKATPSALASASSSDLLRIFDADFGFLVIDGEVRAIGKLEPYAEALAILNFVDRHRFGEITTSENMVSLFVLKPFPISPLQWVGLEYTQTFKMYLLTLLYRSKCVLSPYQELN